jgi:hypothetical protein
MNKETLIKLLVSTLFGLIGGSIAYIFTQAPSFGFLVGWDFFALTYLIISITVFARVPQAKMLEKNGVLPLGLARWLASDPLRFHGQWCIFRLHFVTHTFFMVIGTSSLRSMQTG